MSIQGEPWSQIGRISPPTSPPPHARTKVVFRKRKKEREGGGLKKEKLGHILFFLLFCFVFSSEVLV